MISHDQNLDDCEAEALFVDDIVVEGHSGVLVECSKCGANSFARDGTTCPGQEKILFCTGCDRSLIYRPWCEW